MKLTHNKKQAGLTLIEITLVIAVLLGLISVLFIGVSAYKEGSNRAKCILNISSYQKALRSYQNLYEIPSLDDEGAATTYPVSAIAGEGKLLETFPSCPSGGTYDPENAAATGTIPAVGSAALTCSLAAEADGNHAPNGTDGW